MATREFTTLVVDDEEPIRDTICAALEMNGYPTIQAEDGSAALEVFRKEQPALIVTDIQMPKMNGLELLRAVKKESPDTCVVIMTGYGTEETAIDALRAMGDGGFRHLPVVAEGNLVIGIVSRGDFRGLELDRFETETALWERIR